MVCNYGEKIYNGTDEKWYFTRAIQNECPAAQLPRLCETDITYWYALFLFFEVCNNNRIYIAGGRRQRKAEKIDSRSQRAAIIEKCKEFKKKRSKAAPKCVTVCIRFLKVQSRSTHISLFVIKLWSHGQRPTVPNRIYRWFLIYHLFCLIIFF